MKDKKRYFCVAVCLALMLVGCGEEKYADGVSCDAVAAAMARAVGEQYEELESGYMEFYFEDAEGYDDVSLCYSVDGEDVGEIGVFHAQSEDAADELERECAEYISELQSTSRAFLSSYAPHELTKLEGAEVRRFGRYVIYAVLDSDAAQRAFDAARSMLGG